MSLSVTQECEQPQPAALVPEVESGAANMPPNLTVEMLNLHASASASDSAPPALRSAITADWLEAALDKRVPKDEKSLIFFLHIPKTSGQSFYHFLTDTFGQANLAPFTTWGELLGSSGAAGDWKVWSGHFGGLLPLILPSWPRLVTILRDPVDRAISYMNHLRRDINYPLQSSFGNLSILEYCLHPKLRRTVDNFQARSLASLGFAMTIYRTAKRGAYAHATAMDLSEALFAMDPQYGLLDWAIRAISEIDMVGITEAHEQTLRLFARKFDVPEPIESYHDNKAGESQLKRADLKANELECLQELTQIDQVVYEYARKRFERDCCQAKLGDPFR